MFSISVHANFNHIISPSEIKIILKKNSLQTSSKYVILIGFPAVHYNLLNFRQSSDDNSTD